MQSGSRSELPAAFWDILPTFTELAGKEIPQGIDGLSIVPELTGKKGQQTHPYLYWEFHERGGAQALLKDNWKLVRLHADDLAKATHELYNLANDPGETNNIAPKQPQQLKELSGLLEEAHSHSELFPFEWEADIIQ